MADFLSQQYKFWQQWLSFWNLNVGSINRSFRAIDEEKKMLQWLMMFKLSVSIIKWNNKVQTQQPIHILPSAHKNINNLETVFFFKKILWD